MQKIPSEIRESERKRTEKRAYAISAKVNAMFDTHTSQKMCVCAHKRFKCSRFFFSVLLSFSLRTEESLIFAQRRSFLNYWFLCKQKNINLKDECASEFSIHGNAICFRTKHQDEKRAIDPPSKTDFFI